MSVHGVVQDITARKHAEEQITPPGRLRQPDRAAEPALVPRAVRPRAWRSAADNGTLVALLFIDIDRFKHINDTLGHSDGDELLQQVGAAPEPARCATATSWRARRRARRQQRGAPGRRRVHDAADRRGRRSMPCARVAERLLSALQQPVQLASQEVFVTASIGVARLPAATATTPTSWCARPTSRCTAVKDRGRNGVAAATTDTHEHARRATAGRSRTTLHRALERNELRAALPAARSTWPAAASSAPRR
ncbi:MAG: GGDEF domain-containing protein [Comamonadaceae bacterium]|nr:GGDEF domain-containing protein [Comamonadaceae bacterium]